VSIVESGQTNETYGGSASGNADEKSQNRSSSKCEISAAVTSPKIEANGLASGHCADGIFPEICRMSSSQTIPTNNLNVKADNDGHLIYREGDIIGHKCRCLLDCSFCTAGQKNKQLDRLKLSNLACKG
jgi:hypothetical protein